jgi:glycosyltransferase involved in cell wall biosynthesis
MRKDLQVYPVMNLPSLSIIIPVYNNEESLQILIERLGDTLNEYALENELRVIFVDDGSTDNSNSVIKNLLVPENMKVTLLTHKQNLGQLRAIYSGLRISNAEAIVHLSADLQDPPELILDFLNEYKSGVEIVYGMRKEREDGHWRKATSYIAYRIARIGNPRIPRGGFDYFLISAGVKDELIAKYSNQEFIQGAILKTRSIHKGISYTREKRPYGKSQWTFRKKARLLADILVESTFAPIRVLTGIGFAVVTGAILVLCYFLALRLLGYATVDGFTALAFLVIALGGMNLLIVGILAEYLIRLIKQFAGIENNSFASVEEIAK